MRAALKTLFDISLLSGRPQDLPASHTLLALTLAGALASNYLVDAAYAAALTRFQFAVAEVALLGFTIWIILAVRQRPHRWRQTMIALYGSSTVVNIAAWPIVSWMPQAQSSGVALLLGLVVSIWFIAILARILRFALDASLGLGVLAAVLTLFVDRAVLFSFFPPPQL